MVLWIYPVKKEGQGMIRCSHREESGGGTSSTTRCSIWGHKRRSVPYKLMEPYATVNYFDTKDFKLCVLRRTEDDTACDLYLGY
jgi:hypothetical protein